jgi:hypothetical protein
MKKYLGIVMVLVILLVSVLGCASTNTVTTTEKTTLPAVTSTQTLTTTNNVTTTVNTTVTATSTSTATATTTNVMTTTATVSVTTTATQTVTATVTSTATTTIITTSPTATTTATTSTSVGVPIGTAITTGIIVEEIIPGGYYKNVETHNISITAMEVVRGSKALDMVKAADASNKAPDAGYEYLLARVKFAYGSGGNIYYTLQREYFKAYSSANKEYANPTIVDPKPALIDGTALYQGQTAEGWVSFIVAQNDSKPVMFYTSASTWFRLY